MLIFDFKESFDDRSGSLAFDRPERVVTARSVDEVPAALAAVQSATEQGCYAAGYISYEAAPAFDAALQVKPQAADSSLPLLWFGIYRQPSAPDFADLSTYSVGDWAPDTTRAQYDAAIAAVRHSIGEGEIYQANFTMRLRAKFQGSARAWYDDLQRAAAVHFGAYLDIGGHQMLSLSPELFFAWDGRHITARPMKGTAQRAEHDIEDRERAEALRQSEKNRAENLMIVDLLRNDVSRVARPGSVAVPQLFSLESYPTVYQMTSTVTAETREGTTISEVLRALFPCGSITGAPKIKATEILAGLENSPRGPYCGAIGYIAPGGACVFNVAIRTIVVDAKNKTAECGVGGGIVWDSTAEDEYAEALAKAQFIARAEPDFELIETLRLHAGQYDWLQRHMQRLARSAAELGFAVDVSVVERELAAHAAAFAGDTRRVRLRLARSGAVNISSEALSGPEPLWFAPAPLEPKRIALAHMPIDSTQLTLAHKTTRRTLYDFHRRHHPEAFDVLLWNERDELTEFTIGNLVMQLDGTWYTPPVSSGLLPGVLREELLKRRMIFERVLHRHDLINATSLGFINSVRGWWPVAIG